MSLNICGVDGDMSVILNQHTKESKKKMTKNNSYFTFTKKKCATHKSKHHNQKNLSKLATMMHNFMQRLSYELTKKKPVSPLQNPHFRKISGLSFEKYTKPMTIFWKYNINHFSITALTDRRITYKDRSQINAFHFFSETKSKIITTLNIPRAHSLKSWDYFSTKSHSLWTHFPAVCRPPKTLCRSVGALHVRYVSARLPQNSLLEVQFLGARTMEVGEG